MMFQYKFCVPEEKQIRLIIHTDCKNEADDQYALAQQLMTPKFHVPGIIAGHFEGKPRIEKGTTTKASYDEIKKVLGLMHIEDEYQVCMGATSPLEDSQTPVPSEGAELIIREALREDTRPLYIGLQGSLTDLASAILMEPEICRRMTAIWIGGGSYPEGGHEFNLFQDILAANVVFRSSMPLWQVPKDAYRQMAVSLAELQVKVWPYGKLGRYLFEQMAELNMKLARIPNWPHGETWGLGDQGIMACLMEEVEKKDIYREIEAPCFDEETGKYRYEAGNRKIRVYHTLNARLVLEDFFAKLQINFPKEDS